MTIRTRSAADPAAASQSAAKASPPTLEALTGEKQMDATAILDYFAPLKQWLDEQNKLNGMKVGW